MCVCVCVSMDFEPLIAHNTMYMHTTSVLACLVDFDWKHGSK